MATAPTQAPTEAPVEVQVEAAPKADFADHPAYAAFSAAIDDVGSFASARLHQLLEEARTLINNV